MVDPFVGDGHFFAFNPSSTRRRMPSLRSRVGSLPTIHLSMILSSALLKIILQVARILKPDGRFVGTSCELRAESQRCRFRRSMNIPAHSGMRLHRRTL